jgi:hypothetical protein
MTDSTDPAIDPIDAFVFMFSEDLRKIDPKGFKSAEITRKIMGPCPLRKSFSSIKPPRRRSRTTKGS